MLDKQADKFINLEGSIKRRFISFFERERDPMGVLFLKVVKDFFRREEVTADIRERSFHKIILHYRGHTSLWRAKGQKRHLG